MWLLYSSASTRRTALSFPGRGQCPPAWRRSYRNQRWYVLVDMLACRHSRDRDMRISSRSLSSAANGISLMSVTFCICKPRLIFWQLSSSSFVFFELCICKKALHLHFHGNMVELWPRARRAGGVPGRDGVANAGRQLPSPRGHGLGSGWRCSITATAHQPHIAEAAT